VQTVSVDARNQKRKCRTLGRKFSSRCIGVYAYVAGNPISRVDPMGLTDDFAGGKPTFVRGVPNGTCSCSSGGENFAAPPGTNFSDVYDTAVNSGIVGVPNTGFTNYSAGKASIAQFGTYDYQRNAATNSFIPAYTDAANFAVGVYMSGAGFSSTWLVGQAYAITHSANAGAPKQARLWMAGWEAANSGKLGGICK